MQLQEHFYLHVDLSLNAVASGKETKLEQSISHWPMTMSKKDSAVSCQQSTFLAAGGKGGASELTIGWFTTVSAIAHTFYEWMHLLYISSPTQEQVRQDSGLPQGQSQWTSLTIAAVLGDIIGVHYISPLLTIPRSPLISPSSGLGGLGGGVTQTLILSLCSPSLSWALAAAFIHLSSKLGKDAKRHTTGVFGF